MMKFTLRFMILLMVHNHVKPKDPRVPQDLYTYDLSSGLLPIWEDPLRLLSSMKPGLVTLCCPNPKMHYFPVLHLRAPWLKASQGPRAARRQLNASPAHCRLLPLQHQR